MKTRAQYAACAGIVALAVTFLASPARGQAPASTALGEIDRAEALYTDVLEVPGARNPGTATLLSAAGTVVPVVLGMVLAGSDDSGSELGGLLFTCGIYFGPATGYIYGGSAGRGFAGAGVRSVISLLGYGLMAAACSGDNCSGFGLDGPAVAVGLLTLGGLVTSMVYDMVSVDNVVRRRNEALAAEHWARKVTVAPVVSAADGGTVGVIGKIRL
ncbi:MAG: hypothetical protein M8866_06725 [marine benthic group bacterium]|jgi:hypothetical protein|nr:hypothetical protein [Candidatus Benthicola marisminoris]